MTVGKLEKSNINFLNQSLSWGNNFMGIVCPGGQEVGDWKSGDQMSAGPKESQLLVFIYNHFVFDNFPSVGNFFKAIHIPSHNRLGWDNFLHYKIKDDCVSTCCDGEKQWKRLPLNSTKANLIEFVTWFFFSLSTLVWKAARNLHMYYTLRPLKWLLGM